MLHEIILSSILFGCVAGILSGLFGIGGGLVLVPFFFWLFDTYGFAENIIMIMAIATSLATIIFTASASTYTHHRYGAINWKTVHYLAPSLTFGVIIGAILAQQFSSTTLGRLFAIFMLYVGLKMATTPKKLTSSWQLSPFFMRSVGLLIGIISAILGIGGGTMTVPLLYHNRYPMQQSVAISSACGLPIAITGTLSYIWLGWHNTLLPEFTLGYIYLPAFFGIISSSIWFAPLGAKIANNLPTHQLKRYFSIIVFSVAIKLLWTNH